MTYFYRRWLLVAGLCASVGLLNAQPLSPTQAHDDLLFLRNRLRQLHPGVGYYTPNARMEQLFDSLYNSVTTPVEYIVFYRHVAAYVAALKDGHTNLNHRAGHISAATRFVPFYVRMAEGRYYVSHNASADTTLRRGVELISLNGRALPDIHTILMNGDRTGSDGDNVTGRKQLSLTQFADYYAAWFGSTDSVTVLYRRTSDSATFQARLACPTASQFRATLLSRYPHEFSPAENLSVQIIDPLTRTAVLRVSSFMSPRRFDPFGWAFNRRLRRVFRQIRQENVANLVVDMQSNGGGMVANAARLLRYWMPSRFTVMGQEELKRGARQELITRWNPFSALNFSLRYKSDQRGGFSARALRRRYRPVGRQGFRGNLYFLQNGASFSATTSVLAKTLDAGLGTFVGEATGSAYWGDFAGQFNTITLPHSRLEVRIPLKKLVHDVAPARANGLTVEPDYVVSRSYDDILQNRDYTLNAALRLIRQGVVARPHRSAPAQETAMK